MNSLKFPFLFALVLSEMLLTFSPAKAVIELEDLQKARQSHLRSQQYEDSQAPVAEYQFKLLHARFNAQEMRKLLKSKDEETLHKVLDFNRGKLLQKADKCKDPMKAFAYIKKAIRIEDALQGSSEKHWQYLEKSLERTQERIKKFKQKLKKYEEAFSIL